MAESVGQNDSHNGASSTGRPFQPACYLVVHNVSKRHNIGNLLRNAAAFGVAEASPLALIQISARTKIETLIALPRYAWLAAGTMRHSGAMGPRTTCPTSTLQRCQSAALTCGTRKVAYCRATLKELCLHTKHRICTQIVKS